MSADSLSTILKLYLGSDHFLAIPLLLPRSKLPSFFTWPKWHLGFHSWLLTFHTQSSTLHPEHLVKTWIRLYSSRLGNLQWRPLSLSQNLNLTEAQRLPLAFLISPSTTLPFTHSAPATLALDSSSHSQACSYLRIVALGPTWNPLPWFILTFFVSAQMLLSGRSPLTTLVYTVPLPPSLPLYPPSTSFAFLSRDDPLLTQYIYLFNVCINLLL